MMSRRAARLVSRPIESSARATDLILDYYHAVHVGLPEVAGQLGAAYLIPIIYVPTLMITHAAAFYLLLRPQPEATRTLAVEAARL